MTQEQPSTQNYRGGIGPLPSAGVDSSLAPDERNWGMLAHLLVFIGYLGVPFGNWIGPAIAYFMKKDQSRFVRFHALQAFAFQLLVWVLSAVVAVPLFVFTIVTGGLGMLLVLPFLGIVWLATTVYIVYMGIKASHGEQLMYVLVGAWVHRKVYQEDWKPL